MNLHIVLNPNSDGHIAFDKISGQHLVWYRGGGVLHADCAATLPSTFEEVSKANSGANGACMVCRLTMDPEWRLVPIPDPNPHFL